MRMTQCPLCDEQTKTPQALTGPPKLTQCDRCGHRFFPLLDTGGRA